MVKKALVQKRGRFVGGRRDTKSAKEKMQHVTSGKLSLSSIRASVRKKKSAISRINFNNTRIKSQIYENKVVQCGKKAVHFMRMNSQKSGFVPKLCSSFYGIVSHIFFSKS